MTAPDPKTVREIATEHIRSGRIDIGTTVELMLIGVILDREELAAWENAVQQAIRAAVPSWPDDQQPADVVTAEQQQGGVVEALRVWLASRTGDDQLGQDVRAALDNREAWRNLARSRGVERDAARAEVARAWEDLTTVREERTALAARVAELESEREADTRAVAAFQAASGQGIGEIAAAGWALVERFADRVAALDAGADGGAE